LRYLEEGTEVPGTEPQPSPTGSRTGSPIGSPTGSVESTQEVPGTEHQQSPNSPAGSIESRPTQEVTGTPQPSPPTPTYIPTGTDAVGRNQVLVPATEPRIYPGGLDGIKASRTLHDSGEFEGNVTPSPHDHTIVNPSKKLKLETSSPKATAATSAQPTAVTSTQTSQAVAFASAQTILSWETCAEFQPPAPTHHSNFCSDSTKVGGDSTSSAISAHATTESTIDPKSGLYDAQTAPTESPSKIGTISWQRSYSDVSR